MLGFKIRVVNLQHLRGHPLLLNHGSVKCRFSGNTTKALWKRLMESLKNSTIIEITNSLKTNSIQNSNFVEISDSFAISLKNNCNKEDISLIEDSSDGLQWCTELDYQYMSGQSSSYCHSVPKSIFESSILGSSVSYATPPTSKYSTHLDANLAEIDIETFKSEDINAVFLQQAGEDCASISRSIFEDSISLDSYRSTNGAEEQLIDGSIDALKASEVGIDAKADKTVANTISVDSLDMSLNTSELLMKCTERDQKNYTIAFEGSINGSQELNDSNHQKRLTHSNGSNYSQLDYIKNEVNDRKMTKSEHSVRSSNTSQTNGRNNRNINHRSDQLIRGIDKTIAKLSQSIPDLKLLMRMSGQCRIPYCPVSGFLPLYDLQSSQSSNSHSSGSEFSPPRSLVRMFMQNRSPLSSQPISPSLSYENQSQESANTSDSSFRPLYYNILELTREANNNILLENRSSRLSSTPEECTPFDDNIGKNRIRFDSQRLPTFPIKEVDENMSDSSNTDINMSSVDTNEINANLSDSNRNSLNFYQNLKKESHFSTNPFEKHSYRSNLNPFLNNCSIESNSNANRLSLQFPSRSSDQIRSSAPNLRSQTHSNTRTMSTQIPVHIQDKEVQAIGGEDPIEFVVRETTNPLQTHRPVMTPESPNDSNKPFYVYYPNYSLPDLSFLEQILEEHMPCAPQTVYLSPTKHQLPNRDSVSVQMRRNTTKPKSRPKSYTDYETLSKQNFNHIKDWDSLNILLPNEFKELIQKAKNLRNEEKTELENKNEKAFNEYNFNVNPNPTVRMRSHRSNVQISNNSSIYSNRGYVRNKRYSLQEYPFPRFSDSQTDCHNISHNSGNGCMTRSTTMPDCHSCHCQHHCCHTCCHSCCRTPRQSPTSGAAKPFPSTDINSTSIDKLCQLLAMDLSFKKIMNIINGQNVPPIRTNNFETVVEKREENQNQNNSDINCNNDNESAEQLAQNKSLKDGSNFAELKQRWESLASVGSSVAKSVDNSSTNGSINSNKNEANVSKGNSKQKSNNNWNKSSTKPEIARKPQLVLRRPQSSIPRPTTLQTENQTYSHRKSMIPIPKSGQTKCPVIYATKMKSNIALKAFKP